MTYWENYSTSSTAPDGQKLRDLDETRRLLYTALYARSLDRRAELASTIINALAHHGAGIPAIDSEEHVVALLGEDGDDAARGHAMAWVKEQLDRITELLDG